MQIPRGEVINRLREAGYSYKRKGERVEIHRQSGTGQRVNVTLRNFLDEDEARVVLKQAGLTPAQVDAFLRACTKGH